MVAKLGFIPSERSTVDSGDLDVGIGHGCRMSRRGFVESGSQIMKVLSIVSALTPDTSPAFTSNQDMNVRSNSV